MTDTRSVKKIFLYIVGVVLLVFGLIQLVPYRVTNPSTHREPTWDSARTCRLAVVACFDCHSNDTTTVWWEKVAPLSWWITNHVDDGRRVLELLRVHPARRRRERRRGRNRHQGFDATELLHVVRYALEREAHGPAARHTGDRPPAHLARLELWSRSRLRQ